MANSRPMGYVFPKRIQRAIAGDWSKKTFYGGGLTEEDKQKFAEEKQKKDEDKEKRIQAKLDLNPWSCPICNKLMIHKLDQKYFNRKGMCMECVIKGETYLKAQGLYDTYENATTLRNYKAYLIDIKEQALDFISNLKDDIKVVNHDGSFDTLKYDIKEVKEFMIKEIEDLDRKLEEVADVDMSISALDLLGINLKEIVKGILKEEKEREEHIKKNS